MTLAYILVFTFIGSIFSLIGGLLLLLKKGFAVKISHYLAAFAAGALLGTAFFDLLPEAIEESADGSIFVWTLFGILLFFILERTLHWFHHHHREHGEEQEPTVLLLNFGDAIHNFLDGVAIAATFLVDIKLGIITSFAVAAHEIPQEIGDFGIMLHKGLSGRKVLLLNVLVALTAIAGALITYFLGDMIKPLLPVALSITAGFFIYIASSDLIPEIHNKNAQKLAAIESGLLILGVVVIYVFVKLFE
ncbi:MAG: ZIP family metal transporter [Candidatus Woykebacteria bacterium]